MWGQIGSEIGRRFSLNRTIVRIVERATGRKLLAEMQGIPQRLFHQPSAESFRIQGVSCLGHICKLQLCDNPRLPNYPHAEAASSPYTLDSLPEKKLRH